MRTEHLLSSLLGLCLCFLMLLVGIFLFLIPYLPGCAEALRILVVHHMHGISFCGLALSASGAVILVFLVWLNRRRYLLLKMGGVSVGDRLLAHYAKESLQTLFPGKLIDCDVVVRRKKKIEIMVNLPFVAEQKQERTLADIEERLSALLLKQCQYDRSFILNVSFSTH